MTVHRNHKVRIGGKLGKGGQWSVLVPSGKTLPSIPSSLNGPVTVSGKIGGSAWSVAVPAGGKLPTIPQSLGGPTVIRRGPRPSPFPRPVGQVPTVGVISPSTRPTLPERAQRGPRGVPYRLEEREVPRPLPRPLSEDLLGGRRRGRPTRRRAGPVSVRRRSRTPPDFQRFMNQRRKRGPSPNDPRTLRKMATRLRRNPFV